MNLRRPATVILAASLAGGCIQGASTGSVVLDVHVQNADQQPLAGATISGFGRASEATDLAGGARPKAMAGYRAESFLFWFRETLAYGPFEVNVSCPGYKPAVAFIQQQRLIRHPGEGVPVPATIRWTFTLEPLPATTAEARQ